MFSVARVWSILALHERLDGQAMLAVCGLLDVRKDAKCKHTDVNMHVCILYINVCIHICIYHFTCQQVYARCAKRPDITLPTGVLLADLLQPVHHQPPHPLGEDRILNAGALASAPAHPNVPLRRALWSLLVSIRRRWGYLKG